MHDGVDIDYFKRADRHKGRPRLPIPGLPEDAAIVTYTARGLEPYRGFPQFLQAVALLQMDLLKGIAEQGAARSDGRPDFTKP
jgi:hypothetical protein